MAWTSLSVFSVGQVLTSALMNAIRGNLLELDPSNGEPGSVPRVNATQDGYNFGSGGDDVPIGPTRWGTDIGLTYVVNFGDTDMGGTSAGSVGLPKVNALQDAGWTFTGTFTSVVVASEGSTGGLFDPATVGAAGVVAQLAREGEAITSPVVFGNYLHGRAQQELLGALPTSIVLKVMARFPTVVIDEQKTYLGLSPVTRTGDTVGITIHSGGTNFRLRMGSTGSEDAGAAVDTNWHLFEIHVEENLTTWYIDGVAQGQIGEDEGSHWPMGLDMHCVSNGSNDIHVAWAIVKMQ